MRRRLWGTLSALVLALTTLPVAAQTSAIVLGIRSVEGDEELARNLTGALRHAASQVPGWAVSQADVTLAQMSMVHGCDEPDAACMAEIANELGQGRIVYGTVRRTGAGASYDFALTLYFFNSESGQIEGSLTDTIPRGQTDIDPLRPRAARYLARFTDQTQYGSVRIATNVPGALVLLDGREVGRTDEAGVILVDEVAEGQRDLEISADGHDTFRGSVRIVADDQSEVRANLIATSRTNLRWLPGVGVAAVGAALVVLGGIGTSGAMGQRQERADLEARLAGGPVSPTEPGLTPLQRMLLLAQTDQRICGDGTFGVEGGEDACDARSRNTRRQWIGYGLGAAMIVGGVAWAILSLGGDDDEPASALRNIRLTPLAGRTEAGMSFGFDF